MSSMDWEAPEGGLRAWCAVFYAFLADSFVFGVLNSYAVIYVSLVNRYEQKSEKIDSISSTVALVGSLSLGFYFLISPISGMLIDLIGHRTVAIIGGFLSAIGLLLSSFLLDYPGALYLTFAFMFGGGGSLQIVSGISCMSLYFKKRIGLVNGLSTSGGAMFASISPLAIRYLEESVGLEGVFQILALLMAITPFAAIPLKPPDGMPVKNCEPSIWKKNLIYVENWKNKKYLIWCIALAFAWFGFNIPYVHIVKFCTQLFPGKNGDFLITCLNISSIISRLILGPLGDHPKISNILLLQISLLASGIVILLLPISPTYLFLIVLTLILGFTDGGYVSLIGPIAFQICGTQGGTQAIGFLIGISAIPITAGPPIAGWIYDKTLSYTVPFLLAGGATLLGGLIMSLIYCIKDNQEEEDQDVGELTIFDRESTYYQTYEDISKILVQ